ncbi:hypothetical protein Pcinc_023504 [Petrolisthes cinctipes]|uniref:Uncharacterized protein n=1 Tax=Petrolisthes cinctipes TaxID=88211 RepID=A0AAE1FDE2_PETCI|nr:hypothetical protein Pcinc_023504 [Petrolisthes cinctipes]
MLQEERLVLFPSPLLPFLPLISLSSHFPPRSTCHLGPGHHGTRGEGDLAGNIATTQCPHDPHLYLPHLTSLSPPTTQHSTTKTLNSSLSHLAITTDNTTQHNTTKTLTSTLPHLAITTNNQTQHNQNPQFYPTSPRYHHRHHSTTQLKLSPLPYLT